MEKEYILDLGEKKVEIELLKTELFCRYCRKLNTTCLNKHRSAIIWYIEAKTENCEKYYIIADGEIPPELYETSVDYGIEDHYETGGHWTVPKAITKISEIELNDYINKIKSEPTEYELTCLMHRLFGKHKHIEAPVSVPRILLLNILADLNIKPHNITKVELLWLKKVYEKWLDDSTKRINSYVYIQRIPRSFKERIEFPPFCVSIENKKYTTTVEHKTSELTDITYIYEKRQYYRLLAIYIKYSMYKHVLYWNTGIWHGKEIYFAHEHPECILQDFCINGLINNMIHQRLGDLLFLEPTDEEKFRDRIKPATKDQLQKITFINAKIEEIEENNRKLLKITSENQKLPIIIVHPEHGSIELNPHINYTIYQVPYITSGHD